MGHIDKSEMFTISGPYNNDERIDLDYSGAANSVGAAIAFVIVIFGWAINKIFRRDLLS